MNNSTLPYKKYINYCVKNNIKKIIIFIKDENNILNIKSFLNQQEYPIELIGVTFPANEKMYRLEDDKKINTFIPEAANGNKIKKILEDHGITLISSTIPFEGIVIPGNNINPYKIIEQTLGIVHVALPNLVQTLLMATDNGAVLPGERVVVMNNSLAIDGNGTNTRLLFHPKEGMKINKIIQI